MNNPQSRHDPIVAELHTVRERLADQYHNDLRAYSQAAESHCRELGFRFAESPRRRAIQETPRETEEPA
jgi:hypothetical protein